MSAPAEGDGDEVDTAAEPSLWPQPKSMRRPHQVAGGLLFLFGLFIAWQALGLRYYTSLGPGPGFFSFWLGVILCGLALVMVAAATWGRPEPTTPGFFADARGYLGIGGIVLSLLVAALLLRPLGYPLTLAAIMVFLLRVIGRQSWRVALLGAAIAGFGIYLAFVHWLRVPLPAGVTVFLS